MLEDLTIEEFNRFSSIHPCNTFFQSSYWGDLKETTGWKKHLVGVKENGEVKSATLLLSKKIPVLNKNMFYAPRGFLIDYQNFEEVRNFTKKITQYVKEKKGVFFKINPYVMYQERDVDGQIVECGENNQNLVDCLKEIGYIHNGFTIHYGMDLEPRWISVLDIKNKTEEELLKEMRPTTRSGIQSAYKHGLKLVEIDESRLREFKHLMEHTGERRGFIDRPLSYYENMYGAFHKDNCIKIMLVELNTVEYINNLDNQYEVTKDKLEKSKKQSLKKELGSQLEAVYKKRMDIQKIQEQYGDIVTVAGGLFMTYGNQVLSLFGASYREFMSFNGQYFLNFEMIKYAIAHHYQKFNFYGITGEFNKDSQMYGLFNFKRGFHATVVELIGEFNYIVNKPFYYIYTKMFTMYKKIKKWRLGK